MASTDPSSENSSADKLALSKIEETIKQFRSHLLKPLADRYGFALSKRTGRLFGAPTVLCLGNHSSGKSSFINHLIGTPVQSTGVAPTDDGFTVLLYDSAAKEINGRAAVVDPGLPLGDFEQFGKEFLDHLKVRKLSLGSLQDLCLIDSPGLIDHAGAPGDMSRGYDFPAVVREFAEHSDLIIFFFDPEKPGTTGESLRIFTDSLGDVMYKVLIVFNKVDTFEDVRDFARTYGALCWNLSRIVRTKDMPHIYCTYLEELAGGKQRQIDLVDFAKSTHQLETEVQRVGDRRRSNVVGGLLDASRSLSIHVAVCRQIAIRLRFVRFAIWLVAIFLLSLAVWLWVYHRTEGYMLAAGVVTMFSGVGLLLARKSILKWKLKNEIARLDWTFQSLFQQQLLEHQHPRFLEGLWETVRPKTVRFLTAVGPEKVPYSIWDRRRIKKLRKMVEAEIPKMLDSK